MAVDVGLVGITIFGPLFIGAIGMLGGCPRLGVQGGLMTAIWIGGAGNSPFYDLLLLILVVAVGGFVSVRLTLKFMGA